MMEWHDLWFVIIGIAALVVMYDPRLQFSVEARARIFWFLVGVLVCLGITT